MFVEAEFENIVNIQLSEINEEDEILWSFESLGEYTV